MSEKQYFPVPLAHLTSPIAPALEPQLPAISSRPDGEAPKEPFGMLDVEELPERYGVDQVVVLARDPHTLFVQWEITPEARRLAGEGELTLRISATTSAGAAPTQLFDEVLGHDAGRGYLPAPYPGALVDATIGLRDPQGGIIPLAFAPRLRVPHAAEEAGSVEWMEVLPARTRGLRFEPAVPAARGSAEDIPGATSRALPSGPAVASPASPAAPTPPADAGSSPTRGGR